MYRPLRVALALLIAVANAGCNGITVEAANDEIAEREILACPMPRTYQPIAPPPGVYADRGIRIDYDKLVHREDPHQADHAYIKQVIHSPDMLEQVYHDATSGNDLAAWYVCVSEVMARAGAREAARHVASLKCQAIYHCKYRLEELPLSPDTASGARLLTFMAKSFEAEATRLQIQHDFVANALTLVAGVKVANKVRLGVRMPAIPNIAPARSFKSFSGFKSAMGAAGPGKEWHHIVEQTPGNIQRFGPEALHNTSNVIAMDAKMHRRISGHYSTKRAGSNMTTRTWLSGQSFEAQRQYGIVTLKKFGALP